MLVGSISVVLCGSGFLVVLVRYLIRSDPFFVFSMRQFSVCNVWDSFFGYVNMRQQICDNVGILVILLHVQM